jgi:hypothetical protein
MLKSNINLSSPLRRGALNLLCDRLWIAIAPVSCGSRACLAPRGGQDPIIDDVAPLHVASLVDRPKSVASVCFSRLTVYR